MNALADATRRNDLEWSKRKTHHGKCELIYSWGNVEIVLLSPSQIHFTFPLYLRVGGE
jgi:hypothetical protein